jgi:hypothetical protein
MRRLKVWQWVGMGFLCFIALMEYLNFTEFCYGEGRYLGDQGLIDATIRYEIEHLPPNYLSKDIKKYASVAEFHEVNPNCCDLTKWGDPAIRTWDRRFAIWARRILGVELLIVKLRYRFKDDGQQQFESAHYLIDSCGQVRSVWSWWGSVGNR